MTRSARDFAAFASPRWMERILLGSLLAALAACGGGSDKSPPPRLASHQVGGSVSNLAGSGLTLQNNGGDDLALAADGSFHFTTPVASGGAYNVTVRTQPVDPSQTCTVDRGTGTVADRDVDDISVICSTDSYLIGGTVSGLAGGGLVLQNNGAGDLAIAADGSFHFTTPVASGASFRVTVRSQPANPSQTCTVERSTGAVADRDVDDIHVACTTNSYTIGGTVLGVAGSGLVLQNDGGDDLPISADGEFQFATPVPSGASYDITVRDQPTRPSQTCTVDNASAAVVDADVDDVEVTCKIDSYVVGGTVSGLAGDGLVLQNNAGDDLAIAADGEFRFATPIDSGAAYDVTVRNQPTNQTCTIHNASATIDDTDVHDVRVICVLTTHTVGGTVSGLIARGLVLQNNASDDLPISADGVFQFATPVATGAAYDITVRNQPISRTCTVINATGIILDADVTNVTVTCTIETGEPRFAYVTNSATDSLSVYSIDIDSGALTKTTDVPTGPNGSGSSPLVTDLAKRFAYVVSPGNGAISGYAIDRASGGLTALPGSPFPASVSAESRLAVHPNGEFAYVVDPVSPAKVSVFSIESTGALTPVPDSTVDTGDMPYSSAISPSGEFAYVGNYSSSSVSAYTIDAATGKLAAIAGSPFATGGNVQAIAVAPNARFLYVANWGTIVVFSIDRLSGALSEVEGSPFPGGSNHYALALDAVGKFIYVVHYSDRTIGAYEIDESTGALSPVPGSPFASGGTYLRSFSLDPTGRFAYATSYFGGQLTSLSSYEIDPGTGVVTIGALFENVVHANSISVVGW